MGKNKKRILIGIVALCILGSIIAVGVMMKNNQYTLDENAKDGNSVMESLQEKVDKEEFHFQISPHPIFQSGETDGELMIVNPSDNGYKMLVEIVLDETQQKVYSSTILKPGERIKEDRLNMALEKGEYLGTATFNILDQETEAILGKVQSQLIITVLE
ncbi:MAG: hypothetical protein ACRCU3_09360 [Eubacteriaceae bacterium]